MARPTRHVAAPLSRSRPLLAAAAATVIAVLAAGCSNTLERTRQHTYAPSFNYISDEQLQATMWQLASGVATLDRILSPERVVTNEDRLDVIRTLEQMDTAVAALGPDGWPSNHPRITRHAGEFRRQLERAKRSAQLAPPSYYLAGSISGACTACHGSTE